MLHFPLLMLSHPQDAIDEQYVSDNMRHRIMTFYRHKYEGGQNWHQESILRELPYDMQVRPLPSHPCTACCV